MTKVAEAAPHAGAGFHYRPEIDGLRAIAVLPVLLFHAGSTVFRGGFVGVDVFFAISGYLIAGLLLAELERGTFSIATFYERRARRILPALFVVMAACIPFAWAWLWPTQLDEFGKSLVTVAAFVSNVEFYREGGYFANDVALKPLLHTWSLAVEEQFYIVFPVVLWALWSWDRHRGSDRRWMLLALSALALASLGLAQWYVVHAPNAGFYLAPGRAWELLAGAIAALLPAPTRTSRSRWRHLPGLAGLSLIGASAIAFSDESPFPGLMALVPVGGALLVLRGGTADTLGGQLLSLRWVRGIGLISYSVYLWHQPLFALARAQSSAPPGAAEMLALCVLAVVAGALSWRFVEQPFRMAGQPLLRRRRSVFLAAMAGMTLLGGTGMALHIAQGFPQRATPGGTMGSIEDRLALNFGLDAACDTPFTLSPLCATARRPDTLLWGDSFAMHIAVSLRAGPHPLALRQHTLSDCAPLQDIALTGRGRDYDPTHAAQCIAFNRHVLAWLRSHQDVRTVVLASPFSMYRDIALGPDGSTQATTPEAVARALLRLVAAIRATGAHVVVIAPPSNNGTNIGQCLAATLRDGIAGSPCDFPRSSARRYPETLLRLLNGQVPVIRLDNMLCPGGICRTRVGDTIVYRDDRHISIEGSRWLGHRFDLADRVRAAAR